MVLYYDFVFYLRILRNMFAAVQTKQAKFYKVHDISNMMHLADVRINCEDQFPRDRYFEYWPLSEYVLLFDILNSITVSFNSTSNITRLPIISWCLAALANEMGNENFSRYGKILISCRSTSGIASHDLLHPITNECTRGVSFTSCSDVDLKVWCFCHRSGKAQTTVNRFSMKYNSLTWYELRWHT